QCCKVIVSDSLIEPCGLSARHCRPPPAPRRRRKFIRVLRGALAQCRTLLITLPVYCCVGLSSGPGTGGSEARPPCSGFPLLQVKKPHFAAARTASVVDDPKRPLTLARDFRGSGAYCQHGRSYLVCSLDAGYRHSGRVWRRHIGLVIPTQRKRLAWHQSLPFAFFELPSRLAD